ncbi:hypothetical protein [Aquabacterium sp. NJ1]|uniref:hypothetical protein n=1 Tax=Aquabacterium sp. NJ1 TaxID=1538295 RepID=UPI00126A74FD|nr:hypothetical protein [Aquabacterium sp. NJ1]
MATSRFPNITHALSTAFNVELGLAEDRAIAMYLRSMTADKQIAALKEELLEAFSDPEFSWSELLNNGDYTAFVAASEAEALAYARRVLWVPIFGAKR